MATAPITRTSRWLYGPAPDLLLGCGLWYALAFCAFVVAGSEIRQGGAGAMLPFIVLFFSTPHYGATLLRVYERREDRRGYAFFTLWVTAALAAIFAVGVHEAIVGSVILTVYFTWSPWHYTGQNYGIAVLFLRRRGVDLTPHVKRLLYASFLLSYVLTFVGLHSGGRVSSYAPVSVEDLSYGFLPLGIPSAWGSWAFAIVAAAYAVTLVGAAFALIRRASLRDLAPAAALVMTQALWFSVPLALRQWHLDAGIEPLREDLGAYYFFWIAIGHSVQYVWVTSYYAKAGGRWSGQARYFAKAMAAGAAIWTVPALVFAPELLGRLPFEAGLGVLVAATVNIHHFILDGAIWKLRDGRVARILLRSREGEDAGASTGPERRRVAPVVWATGALCFAIMFGAKWEREFGVRQALGAGDLGRVRSAVDRLERVGRDSPKLRIALANMLAREGSLSYARLEYEAALDLYPTKAAWLGLARLHSRTEQWEEAAAAYEETLKFDPEMEQAWYNLGLARMKLDQPELARDAFARAFELRPDRKINQVMLERAEAASSD
jgi:tetratricopeptide (TPR) repeat protein